jgi:hypothetical protein
MLMKRAVLLAVLVAAVSAVLAPAPAEATPAVKVYKIYYDSPGSDTRTNTSLNAEYIVLKNMTTSSRSITGWTVRDLAGHIYKFGTLSIPAGKTVTLHTGKGTNSSTHRYWGSGAYIWNNDKDTAYLRNSAGTLIHSCAYNSTAVDYKYC